MGEGHKAEAVREGLPRDGVRAKRKPRVAVLWTRVTGYVHAELRALADAGAEVMLVHQKNSEEAPFDPSLVTAGFQASSWADTQPDVDQLKRKLEAFDPDALLISSWRVGSYRRVGRAFRGKTLRVVGMDNQWLGTVKQWGGVALSRFIIRPTYDAAFLPADRQAAFAERLGFDAQDILWGLYTCDYPRFAAVAEQRGGALPPEAFLFAGRLVPEKGVDVLVEAYTRYRQSVSDPWSLKVVGAGPEERYLAGEDGVEMLGFVQPDQLPEVMAEVGCLVLPSRFEPWALVIHEAAAAELPVVCTSACGATSRLVLDGYNGHVVPPEDPIALATALERVHRMSGDQRRALGTASGELARQFTPERWASTLLGRMPELRSRVGLVPAPWLDRAEEHV